MSDALLWQVLRKNNAFVKKRGGVEFSVEKGNVTSLNSYKYSGLVGSKAIDVAPTKGGVAVSTKTDADPKNPAKVYKTVKCKKGRRSTVNKAYQMAVAYRPDLAEAVRAKASGLTRGGASGSAAVASAVVTQ
eukprot:CAMPEP_0198309152 /NCGR_PEP_ID=MMETSP1450-20131203/1612_1 /TAXON_ID=753684 ORGANISM="Madagascaria erythrocladiodes, Strain CCMP3234" /NCGR_SAMPLE_ID=MMETSP1450 /ASSEMBLY_ACC=CAM_ASM_001115 /LENGTH=131 /DNA_ID=CAMNT_0044011895 /DNA_START=28 /DNA_END=423 /DNA_ORIENTATION=-